MLHTGYEIYYEWRIEDASSSMKMTNFDRYHKTLKDGTQRWPCCTKGSHRRRKIELWIDKFRNWEPDGILHFFFCGVSYVTLMDWFAATYSAETQLIPLFKNVGPEFVHAKKLVGPQATTHQLRNILLIHRWKIEENIERIITSILSILEFHTTCEGWEWE